MRVAGFTANCDQALAAERHIGSLAALLELSLVRFEMNGCRHVTTPFSSVTDRPGPGRSRQ